MVKREHFIRSESGTSLINALNFKREVNLFIKRTLKDMIIVLKAAYLVFLTRSQH